MARPDYRALTASEVGCLLSHRGCWRRIAAGSDEYAAVFEDDIDLSHNGADCLRDISWIPNDADLVKLEAYRQKIWVGRKCLAAPVNYSVARLWSTHWGTAGYIVSRACAARLVKATERLSVTADDALFNPGYAVLRSTVVYQISPAVCVQRQYNAPIEAAHPYRSTVRSFPPGPEAVVKQSKLRRETLRLATRIWRLLKLQVALRVPFPEAGDAR
jgi:glycosyl transferase family 25